ncbi:hypothetical protein GCM10022247_64360 [Allokutzneria multivorans]|uniref:Uncharacterized protein n=1 Tax=Allokutzneria multivorans TaxID=1142134 RepID=A0ABP7TSM8_9PSEU
MQERRRTTPPTWAMTITGAIAPKRMHAAVTAVFATAIPAMREEKSPQLDLPNLVITRTR